MKTKLIIVLLSGLTIIGCKKSEKDFVGKYEVMYSAPTTPDEWGYYDLNKIDLEVFKDQSGLVKGQGAIFIIKGMQNQGSWVGQPGQSAMFDLTNFRIGNDTLFFLIENQVLGSQGKKLNGFIYKGDNGNIVGIDKNMTYTDGVEKSPCFLSKNSTYVFYKEWSNDEEMKKKYRQFYEVQVEPKKAQLANVKATWRDVKWVLQQQLNEIQKHLDGK
jgi:hypothetical protein